MLGEFTSASCMDLTMQLNIWESCLLMLRQKYKEYDEALSIYIASMDDA